MKRILPALLPIILFLNNYASMGQQPRTLSVALLANATALPTHGDQIFKSFHPGLVVGTAFRYNQRKKNQLSQTLKLGYNYHQFVHHSVQVYTEFEYKRYLNSRINIAGAVGVGYAHIFSNTQVFRLNEAGQYEKKPNRGRPQGMGTFALGVGYLLNRNREKPIEIFTRYQFWVQAPYVNKYVPVLPNTTLQLGLNYPFFKRKK